MSTKQNIASGVSYLSRIINDDGGIPAISEGDVSGVWTTAEALEALMLAPSVPRERFTFASRMWQFLLQTQLAGSGDCKDQGAWPLVKGGSRGSAMATGHAVVAIRRTQEYFGARCPVELEQAAERGLGWLQRWQADNGGWGVEPSTPPHGSQPRMISTVYAVAAFTTSGFSVETSQNLRNAKQWLLSMRSEGGGFSGGPGHMPDPCNTARALSALVEMRAVSADDKVVINGLRYIESVKPKLKPWETGTESFVIEGSSGEVIFNSNTPADVLVMLTSVAPKSPLLTELVQWFATHQQANGSWPLNPEVTSRAHICTWSTSEAILGLSRYEWNAEDVGTPNRQPSAWSRRVAVAGILALCVETALLLRINDAFVDAWNRVPKSVQTILLSSIILAIIVNLASNLIYDALRRRR